MKKILLLILLMPALRLLALSDAAVFAAAQEKRIAARSAEGQTPRDRLSREYVLRRDYGERLETELDAALRAERYASPEIKRLQAERAALEARYKALNEAIFKAGQETPEAQEYKAIMKANADRVSDLRKTLWPKSDTDGTAPKAKNGMDKTLRQ